MGIGQPLRDGGAYGLRLCSAYRPTLTLMRAWHCLTMRAKIRRGLCTALCPSSYRSINTCMEDARRATQTLTLIPDEGSDRGRPRFTWMDTEISNRWTRCGKENVCLKAMDSESWKNRMPHVLVIGLRCKVGLD